MLLVVGIIKEKETKYLKEQCLRINYKDQNTYPGILEHQKTKQQKNIHVYIHTVENVGPERHTSTP